MADLWGGGDPMSKVRPTHPDFFRLAEIVLQHDGRFEGVAEAQQERVLGGIIGAVGDSYSISYMATQRTMRILGIVTARDLRRKRAELDTMSAVWVDGFVAGAQFEKRGGAQNPKGA